LVWGTVSGKAVLPAFSPKIQGSFPQSFSFGEAVIIRAITLNARGAALVLIVWCLLLGNACSPLQVGIYLLTHDYDGKAILNNEDTTKKYLEEILASPEKYMMTAYTRRAFAAHIKRTPLIFHSFYVITNDEGQFITLSFSATAKTFYSEGAWTINTETDLSSYNSFIYGTNEWEVAEIPMSRGIDIERTIKNILLKIDSDIIYYYKDHTSDKINMENCNTAIQNTLTEGV
jgi:hypothetical protein